MIYCYSKSPTLNINKKIHKIFREVSIILDFGRGKMY